MKAKPTHTPGPLQHIVRFYPAFDKRHPKPSQHLGIHGVDLLMVVKGPKGAVQFMLYTNWQLPSVQRELEEEGKLDRLTPLPADLGYHSYTPKYEGQSTVSDACEWLENKPCYYDGSSLNAERIFNILLAKGDEGVWCALENYYKHTFDRSGA